MLILLTFTVPSWLWKHNNTNITSCDYMITMLWILSIHNYLTEQHYLDLSTYNCSFTTLYNYYLFELLLHCSPILFLQHLLLIEMIIPTVRQFSQTLFLALLKLHFNITTYYTNCSLQLKHTTQRANMQLLQTTLHLKLLVHYSITT